MAALDAVRRFHPGVAFRVEVPTAAPWDGASWGLAVALAALSAVRLHAMSDRVVATGEVQADGRIRNVGHRHEKVQLMVAARPRARMFVPDSWADVQRPGVVRCVSLEDAWAALAPPHRSLDDALDEVRRLDREGHWMDAAVKADLLLDDEVEDHERARLLVLLLVASNHLADIAAQSKWATELATVGTHALDEVSVARALGSRIVSCVDRFAIAEAESLLAVASKRPWGRESLVHVRGPEALFRSLRGEHNTALAIRRENAEVAAGVEQARCLGDLADAWLRVGQPERALECIDAAFRAAEEARRHIGYQELTKAYLVLHRARALHVLGRDDEALAALRDAPGVVGLDPQLRWRLLECEILADMALVDAHWRALPAGADRSVVIQALFERTRARLGDGEAEASLRSRAVFAGLDLAEAGRRLPY